jgi:hypothetical protein
MPHQKYGVNSCDGEEKNLTEEFHEFFCFPSAPHTHYYFSKKNPAILIFHYYLPVHSNIFTCPTIQHDNLQMLLDLIIGSWISRILCFHSLCAVMQWLSKSSMRSNERVSSICWTKLTFHPVHLCGRLSVRFKCGHIDLHWHSQTLSVAWGCADLIGHRGRRDRSLLSSSPCRWWRALHSSPQTSRVRESARHAHPTANKYLRHASSSTLIDEGTPICTPVAILERNWCIV